MFVCPFQEKWIILVNVIEQNRNYVSLGVNISTVGCVFIIDALDFFE